MTEPSEWCPHPEKWHTPDADSMEVEVAVCLAGLIRAMQPAAVLETGTYLGYTAFELGSTLLNNGAGKLWTIERNERFVAQARSVLNWLPIEVVHAKAIKWIPPDDVKFDLIILDTQPGLRRYDEFIHFKPYTNPGAVIALHDTRPGEKCAQVVHRLVENHHVTAALTLRTPRGLTLCQV